MSEEERLRRAEEVSYRRQNRIPVDTITTNEEENTVGLSKFGKFFIQVIVSICIFGIVYLINEKYSLAFEKVKPIMNKDMDFNGIYQIVSNAVEGINSNVKSINENLKSKESLLNNTKKEKKDTNSNEITNITETSEISNINEEENKKEESNSDENKNEETKTNSEAEEKSKDNKIIDDATYIKTNFSLIKPIDSGWISSRFGTRTATEVVSGNHEGVDLAVNSGTNVKASMEGKVKEVSNYGDYGTHIIIENKDVTTLYAHLSQSLVNTGDNVKQGQIIGKTGSTGKSTGPHLHFEIRRNNKPVNPQEILSL